jgi:hypothetical protein
VLTVYQTSLDGLDVVVSHAQGDFIKHSSSARTDESCSAMAATLTAVANRIPDTKIRGKWVLERWREIQGHECYTAAHQDLWKRGLSPDDPGSYHVWLKQ